MSWPTVTLAEVCKIVSGATPRTGVDEFWEDGDVWWATPKDLSGQRGMEISQTAQKITKAGYKSCSAEMLPVGSVLLSSRAPIGYVAINTVPMCTNQGFKNLVPDVKRLHNGYLYFWLRANRDYLNSLGNGATFKEISKATVARIEIPLPPLADQRRIAAVLDKADALRHKRRDALAHLDRLLQSVFVEMFGDPSTNPKQWPMTNIGSLITEANYGSSSKAGAEGAYPMLRMNNLTYSGGWNFTDWKYIDLSPTEAQKYLVRKGEILFNRTNSKELVGKTAVYRRDEPVAFAGYLIRLKIGPLADAEYISAFLNSAYGKKVLLNMCKSIVGMANINAQELKSISIPQPPAELQKQFAGIVHRVELEKAKHIQAQTDADALFAALQARAFAGEL